LVDHCKKKPSVAGRGDVELCGLSSFASNQATTPPQVDAERSPREEALGDAGEQLGPEPLAAGLCSASLASALFDEVDRTVGLEALQRVARAHAEVEFLRAENARLRSALRDSQRQDAIAQTRAELTESRLQEAKREIESLTTQSATLEQRVAEELAQRQSAEAAHRQAAKDFEALSGKCLAAIEGGVPRLKEELDERLRSDQAASDELMRLRKQLEREAKRCEQAERQLAKERDTLSFRLGYMLIHSTKSLKDFVLLPLRLWELRREARRRRRLRENAASAARVQDGPVARLGSEARVQLGQQPTTVRIKVQGKAKLYLTGRIYAAAGERSKAGIVGVELDKLPSDAASARRLGLRFSAHVGVYEYLPTTQGDCEWGVTLAVPEGVEHLSLHFRTWYAIHPIFLGSEIRCERHANEGRATAGAAKRTSGAVPNQRPKSPGHATEGPERARELAERFRSQQTPAAAVELLKAAVHLGTLHLLEAPIAFLRGSSSQLSDRDEHALRQAEGYLALCRDLPRIPERGARKPVTGNTVAMVLHGSLPQLTNGYATRAHSILRGLGALPWRVVPITRPGFPRDVMPDAEPRAIDVVEGVEYRHLDGAHYRLDSLPEYLEKSALVLEQELREHDVDIVHAASAFTTALPALIAARRLGLPFIYEVRGLWEITRSCTIEGWGDTQRFELERSLEALVARNADRVVTLTEGLRRELVLRGARAAGLTLLPNGVDLERFVRRPPDEKLKAELGFKDEPVIGFVGSLTAYEGLDDLLYAMQMLMEAGTRFRGLVVGDGAELPALRNLSKRLGLDGRVTFTGRVPFERAEAYYSLIDVAPFPRKPNLLTELVSPLKPFEAMAKGVAVVASGVGALREIVLDGTTGLLHRKGDARDLARCLEDLLTRPERRRSLAAAAYEFISRERSWSSLVRRLDGVYSDLTARPEEATESHLKNPPGERPRRVMVYGDVNLNLIDGSAIWATALVELLAGLKNCEVWLVTKAPVEREVVLEPLRGLPNVVVYPCDCLSDAATRPMEQAEAASLLLRLHQDVGFDAIVVRGLEVASALAADPGCRNVLVPYLVEVFQLPDPWDEATRVAVGQIARASMVMLCQTEGIRRRLEEQIEDARGRTALLPPMVPGRTRRQRETWCGDRPIRLVYCGKLDPLWGSRELFDAVNLVNDSGLAMELHVYGDKIHNPPSDRSFKEEILVRLEQPNVVWHKGIPRAQVLRELPEYDLGWAWRPPELDGRTDEVSTKVIEYCSAGVPMVLLRNEVNTRLLGQDYPLFLDTWQDIRGVLKRFREHPGILEDAGQRVFDAAAGHTFDAVRENHLAPALSMLPQAPRRHTVLVAGHDLKFLTELIASFRRAGYSVLVDPWESHTGHDEKRSLRLLREADTVVCEWCLGNAVWYSRHVGSGQKLLVRFHRQELETGHPEAVDWSRVDTLVFIAPQVQADAVEAFPSMRAARPRFIWNYVNAAELDRPKHPAAAHTLGLVGMVPQLKRLDRALDILERVVRVDESFTLRIKGKRAADYAWMAKRPNELAYFEAQEERIRQSPLLQGRVHFDPHGSDMPEWYRGIGYILSVSDVEGSHVAVSEAMASGAIPVITGWRGAEDLYPREHCYTSVDEAAEQLLRNSQGTPPEREARAGAAKRYIREFCDVPVVANEWLGLVATQGALSPVSDTRTSKPVAATASNDRESSRVEPEESPHIVPNSRDHSG
jgi:glycosyltransferase involved in cell wall biosynthesis